MRLSTNAILPMSKRITELPGNETKWIRIPGLIVGIVGVLYCPYMLFVGGLPMHMGLAGVFLSALFILYGIGGSKLLFKYLYTTKVKVWKLW